MMDKTEKAIQFLISKGHSREMAIKILQAYYIIKALELTQEDIERMPEGR